MAKVVAFSGGCHSGKTTTMNKIAELLRANGYKVNILSELMREVTDLSIDELRKQPSKYLDVQEQIISKKIEQEIAAFEDTSDTIYLVDRAITDSLFYLENYVDKSQLSEVEIIRLCNLDFVARTHAISAFDSGYDSVIAFKPLDIINNDDTYRPAMLDSLKDYEYEGINVLNMAYMWQRANSYSELYDFYLEVNVKYNSAEFIMNVILDNLYHE